MSNDQTAQPGPYDASAVGRARAILDAPPTQIGPYRILERLGAGGMGEVYRAEQRSPIRREVAIKIIKLGMDTKLVLARFEAERQALAMMDHPHIARVFDAGADDVGRPYFVMEYVKGIPITQYADEKKLPIRQRLDLFGQVCQAIQHAHHKGVIHRDLKPSNVLVITQDGKPFAKVIDFGIAKATSSRLTDKTLFTEHKTMIGTPEYMSPEQADGNIDIDTRTDVYSLGVLLYELLTGQTPFDGIRLRSAAYDAMVKIIREEEPPKPSARLSTLSASKLAATPPLPLAGEGRGEGLPEHQTPSLLELAKSRALAPDQLVKQVKGELDWLVMKALDKDRARRYATPTDFAQDVERYLNGTPIVAAPPSWGYRARKFGKKHKSQIAIAVIIGIILAAGSIGTTWGLIEANRQRDALAAINHELRTSRDDELKRLVRVYKVATDAQDVWIENGSTLRMRDKDGHTGFMHFGVVPSDNFIHGRNPSMPSPGAFVAQYAIEAIEQERISRASAELALAMLREAQSSEVNTYRHLDHQLSQADISQEDLRVSAQILISQSKAQLAMNSSILGDNDIDWKILVDEALHGIRQAFESAEPKSKTDAFDALVDTFAKCRMVFMIGS